MVKVILKTILLSSILALVACQPQEPPKTTGAATSAPGTVAVAIVPLKLTTTPEGEKQFHFKTLELKDDGSLTLDGKPHGKLLSDHLESAEGRAGPPFKADGTIIGDHGATAVLGVDTLSNAKKEALTVNNDGSIMLTRKTGEKVQVAASFETFPPAGKHAALLVLTTTTIAYPIFSGDN